MRILVLQLTRLGDVLQTTPLLANLREQHPHAHMALMVRPMGKPVADRIPCVDEVLVYDEDVLFAHLRADDSDRLFTAFDETDTLVQRLRNARFDIAYNCTHNIASAMLLRLAQIPRVVGAHMSEDWQFLVRGAWPNYFFTSALHRAHNDLNLCDLTARFAEDASPRRSLTFALGDEDRAAATRLLSAHGIAPTQRPIAVQLGASDTYKRWPPEKFAAAVQQIAAEARAPVVLLGVASEAPLGEAFETHAPGIAAHLYGKTTVPVVAAVLERAQLLLTNDTGTQHLAAAVGCPVLLVSVGYVHFRETGPYAPGNVAVEGLAAGATSYDAAKLADDETITPEHVVSAAHYILHRDLPADSSAWARAGMYRSAFAPDGCVAWYPLIRRCASTTDVLRQAYRMTWLHELDGAWSPHRENEALRAWMTYFDGLDDTHVAETRKITEALAALAGQGVSVAQQLLDSILANNLGGARRLSTRLSEIDDKIRIFGAMHDAMRPITAIAGYERNNLEDAPALVLAQESLARYERVQARARRLGQKLALFERAPALATEESPATLLRR